MDIQIVYEKIQNILVSEFKVSDQIEMSSVLKDQLALDSIKLMELMNSIEDEFNISIDDEDFEQPIVTITDLVNLIKAKI